MRRILLTVAVLATAMPLPARAGDVAPLRMDLRLGGLAAPVGHKAGEDMPVYVAYSSQTSFSGDGGAEYLTEPMYSNTVTVPRSALGGPGSYEWREGWGVVYGPGPVHPTEHRFADNLYVWSSFPASTAAAPGEDLGHLHHWFTDHQPWVSDPEPSAEPGSLGWEHLPDWSRSITATTRQHARLALSRGTMVEAPVPSNFDSEMIMDHAFLEARGGDVTAGAGGLAAPPLTVGGTEAIGRDMAFQMVSWTSVGSYARATVTPDFTAGRASALGGAWRLPLDVRFPEGDAMPAREDRDDVATPQYTLPVTAIGIPEDEDRPPGVIRVVSDLRPGQRMVGIMAVRIPGGSLRTSKVVLDEPGRRIWRVEDGELVPEPGPEQAYALAGEDAGIPAADGLAVPAPAPDDAAPAGTATEVPDGAGGETTPRFETNAAGRTVARDVRFWSLELLDSFDVARVLTEDGPIELGPHNRDGQAVVSEGPDGHETWARTAYFAGGTFVLVEMVLLADTFAFFVETHPLDRSLRPYVVESVADPGDSMRLSDTLSGPIERATVLLDAEVPPVEGVPINGGRLLIGNDDLTLTAIVDAGGGPRTEVEVRNRFSPAAGEPLVDPVIVTRAAGPSPYTGPLMYPFYPAIDRAPKVPTSGRFTAVRTYRLTRQRGDVIGETRDFDGAEPIGIAFSAVNGAGAPLSRSAISSVYVDIRTLSGELLFQRTAPPNFSPDGGASWGVALVPIRELPPAEVVVYARAVHAGGAVRTEASPGVPPEQWRFRIDRIPVTVSDTAGGTVRGTTEPGASVVVGLPELGVAVATVADDEGAYAAQLDLSSAPGGEYEVVVEARGAWPEDPEKALSQVIWPNMTDAVPDDEYGIVTARLRHFPGGADPSAHRSGPLIDRSAGEEFLRSSGGIGTSLRTTAWTVRALDGDAPGAAAYLHSLASGGGFGWRAGDPASAPATGLAVEALSRLGEAPAVDAGAFLRWDGGAAAAPGADVSSPEATARLVLGLDAAGRLEGLDPWWRGKITRYLEGAVASTTEGAFDRGGALRALGAEPAISIPGSDLDAVAYRVLLGQANVSDLASFQTHGGGFTFRPDGDTAEALPTAIALAAAR